MRITPIVRWIFGFLLFLTIGSTAAEKPINALIITGGCCHNYAFQSQAITQAIAKVAQVKWTILQDPRTGTRGEIDLYKDPHWADPYDIIIHNECFADTDDAEYIRRITEAHKAGKPAIVIHCAMHTYRAAKVDDWREFLGVTSRRHDHMSKYPVKAADATHPIMKDFPAMWTTPPDELYVIEKLWPGRRRWRRPSAKRMGKRIRSRGCMSLDRRAFLEQHSGIRTKRFAIRFI